MSGNSQGPPLGPPPSHHYPPPPTAPTNGLKYGNPTNYVSPHKLETQVPSSMPPPSNAMYAPPAMAPPSVGPPPSSSGQYVQSTIGPTGLNSVMPPPPPSGPPLAAYPPPSGPVPGQSKLGPLSVRPPALDTNVNEGYAGNLYPQAQHQMKSSRSTNAFNSKTSPSNLGSHVESSGSLRRNQSSSEFSTGSGGKKTSRIDPAQMPRPDRATSDVVYHTRSGSGRRNPPSCNTIYRAIDTGMPIHLIYFVKSLLEIQVIVYHVICE